MTQPSERREITEGSPQWHYESVYEVNRKFRQERLIAATDTRDHLMEIARKLKDTSDVMVLQKVDKDRNAAIYLVLNLGYGFLTSQAWQIEDGNGREERRIKLLKQSKPLSLGIFPNVWIDNGGLLAGQMIERIEGEVPTPPKSS